MKETLVLPSEELTRRFTAHNPTPAMMAEYSLIRGHALVFADAIDKIIPDGREKSLAMTNVEQASGWAVAAITRNPHD